MGKVTVLIEELYTIKKADTAGYNNEKKNNIEILADFINVEEYHKFTQEIGKRATDATAFKIKGVKHSKRISKGKYYLMDVGEIKQHYRLESISNSYIYDFELIPIEEPLSFENIFSEEKHFREGDYFGGSVIPKDGFDFQRIINTQNQIDIWVNNVGQGNWNEVRESNETRIVYDMGAGLNAPKMEVDALINRIVPRYNNLSTKPIMILSHWDKDHYHALLGLSDEQIGLFGKYVFVGNPPTATARKAYYKIINVCSNVMIIKPNTKRRGMPSLPKRVTKPNSIFSLYLGQVDSNRNLVSYQLFIRTPKSNALLCGDGGWFQINHIIAEEATLFKQDVDCNIVVPHHGSGVDKTYYGFVLHKQMKAGKAIISVEKQNNIYGHPSQPLINYLESLEFDVYRTDESTTDIVIHL